MKTAAAQVGRDAPAEAPEAQRESRDMITTAVHIPRDVHEMLRLVAVRRANRQGGRPSVSAVLTELVRGHWIELQAEAEQR